MTIVIANAKDAIQALADVAEQNGADANDSTGIVRQLVSDNLSGRPDAQFSAWFCVCIELGERSARAEGYHGAVERAWALAHQKVSA